MCKRMQWNKANNLVRAVLMVLLPVGVALLTPPVLHAQAVNFGGVQTTVASGLNSPLGVAVDRAGDVFIADDLNNRVLKISPSGAHTTSGSGLSSPQGGAAEGGGPVFLTADSPTTR